MKHSSSLLSVLLLLLINPGLVRGDDEMVPESPPAEFYIALRQFADWRNSLDSMIVEFSWTGESSDEEIVSGEELPVLRRYRSRFLWQDWWSSPAGQCSKTVTTSLDPAHQMAMTINGSIAECQFIAEYPQFSEVPGLLTTTDHGEKKTLPLSAYKPLLPIYFATSGWFQGAFERFPPRFIGWRTIQTRKCIGVKLNHFSMLTLWLDPIHDGLPVRIETISSGSHWTWECTEFFRTATGQWFPRRGQFGFPPEITGEFQVGLVELNGTISSTEFKIPKVGKTTFLRELTKQKVPLEMVDTLPGRHAGIPTVPPFSWWRVHCILGMLLTSTGWFCWRRTAEKQRSSLVSPGGINPFAERITFRQFCPLAARQAFREGSDL